MITLIKAVLNVMKECKTLDKNMVVGTGNYAYKGVSDADVKMKIGKSMIDNGLVIFPINIEDEVKIESIVIGDKIKQSVFTKVKVKYLLCHESGESIELMGYGHGVDTQDKGAGKACTYSLKYVLIYTFLVATGVIDDADNSHSNNYLSAWEEALSEINSNEQLDNFIRQNLKAINADAKIADLCKNKRNSLTK